MEGWVDGKRRSSILFDNTDFGRGWISRKGR